MTRPSAKINLTPELYGRFASYHRRELAWGVFHVWLDDDNYRIPVRAESLPSDATDEERELWSIFCQLSPSQIARIAKRCR